MLRIMIAFILGGTFAWMIFFRSDEAEDPEEKGQRYRPYLEGWLLPGYAALMLIAVLFFPGWSELAKRAAACMIMMFLHISLYFVLLLLAQSLLRRHLRAGTCAMLWLTPNYLYLAMSSGMVVPPRWVISMPQGVVERLAAVWLAGALVMLGWKIFSHLRFRRWLLRGAEEVSDPAVLAVWQAEVERARVKKPKFRLVTSPQASTPITIGLFPKSVRVVLPQRHYTPEELKLIFRHELVHIGREDAWNKFFVAFCIAMCWFNPLMWMAMGRSSEDLELSCDEKVVSSLEAGERRQYADLILRTAGDGRGFTTCLSASASALRYRLKGIVQPPRRRTGAVLVGVAAGLLILAFGQVGVACGVGTGAESLFGGKPGNVSLTEAAWTGERPYVPASCWDEGALTDYLSSLTLYQMAKDYPYPGDGVKRLSVTYETPRGELEADLYRDGIRVMTSWEESSREHYYYVSGGLDWETLDQLLGEPA